MTHARCARSCARHTLAALAFLPLIRPANHFLTALAEDVADAVHAGDQQAIFRGPLPDVDGLLEQVSPPMTAMEALGNDRVGRSEVGETLAAAVDRRPRQGG